MAVRLSKGDRVSLSKDRVVTNILVGLGWSSSSFSDDDYDLDASCFILQKNGITRYEEDFVFYGNKTSKNGSVQHSGDNLHGSSGNSDDETIVVDLAKLPSYADRLVFVVSIYEAERRMQNFSIMSKAYIRVVDQTTGEEILRYDLKDKFDVESCIIPGEIYKEGSEWKFHAVGQGAGGLADLCKMFGLEVEE